MSKNKRMKPAEAVFDDKRDYEAERFGVVYDPDAPDVRTGLDSGAASAGECTGLIPSGGDLTEDEFEAQKDIFPFAQPNILPR